MSEIPSLWFAFRDGLLLVSDDGPMAVPRRNPASLGLEVLFEREVGSLNGSRCRAVGVADSAEPPEGFAFRDLRGMLYEIDEGFFGMAGRAKQVVGWDATHRFCGRCGAGTEPMSGEMAKRCPSCGMVYYPRLSPAVIVRITDGDYILLARSPGFPPGLYSVLAGFVEPGESMEETIRREVREEVGVEVKNVRYFGSQPWPFPNSLMVGFTADYAGGEIRIDPTEVEDAGWYTAEDLPTLPPPFSIARAMIDRFVVRQETR